MAEGDVWLSKLFSNTSYVRPTDIDPGAPGWRAFAENRAPSSEELPLPIFAAAEYEVYDNLPPIFEGGGGTKVCTALGNIFRQFSLGNGGGVFPVQLYCFDRKTPGPGGYSIVVFREEKTGLVPEHSQGLRAGKYASTPPRHWVLNEVEDFDVAVRASARTGADIWFDSALPSVFFLSNRLVLALKDAGFAKHFNPIRCRIVGLH